MPKVPINYSKTQFYKIVCKDTSITDCYVGHTTNFVKRRCQHKYCCLTQTDPHYCLKLYDVIRKNGGWQNWEMVLIHTEQCQNSLEASTRERYYKEQLNANLNIHIPSRSEKEYRENHKEKQKEYKKVYNINNKDYISKQKKEWYDDKKTKPYNCECGSNIPFLEKKKTRTNTKAPTIYTKFMFIIFFNKIL